MAKRTLDNTGTCACCGQNVKLGHQTATGKIGFHGFKRPRGWQNVIGQCCGWGKDPLEVSPEGLVASVVAMKKLVKTLEDKREALQCGTLTTLMRQRKEITSADPFWEIAKKEHLVKIHCGLNELHRDIKRYTQAITDWKAKPLPCEPK